MDSVWMLSVYRGGILIRIQKSHGRMAWGRTTKCLAWSLFTNEVMSVLLTLLAGCLGFIPVTKSQQNQVAALAFVT